MNLANQIQAQHQSASNNRTERTERTGTPKNETVVMKGHTYLQSATKAAIDRWYSPSWKENV